MRYIKFIVGNGYCGCDFEDYIVVSDGVTDKDIENYVANAAYENAIDYEHVADGYDSVLGWIDRDSEQDYYDNLTQEWKEITQEEFEKATKELWG